MKKNNAQRILMVTSECFPLIKTGGLADVAGALPLALKAAGAETRVFLPGFPDVMKATAGAKRICKLGTIAGGPAQLLSYVSKAGLDVIILDAPELFDISGNPYLDEKSQDRADNHLRYAIFARLAADIALGKLIDWQADVVHCHDWQAGLTPAYLKAETGTAPKTIFTIHNLAFQGLFPKDIFNGLGLPDCYFAADGVEYWDQVSYMKSGIMFSDWITTVSPTYASEIQTDEGGMGFGGLLASRGHTLSGIINGIDTDIWNPETDPVCVKGYSSKKLSDKAVTKKALQQKQGLRAAPKAPVFCVISRLTTQKGLDLLAGAVDHIVHLGGQLIVLGSGDKTIEDAFLAAAKRHPTEVSVTIGYDEQLAHMLQAGSDANFIPSRFEPCGLTQLCALRYGTLPIVGRVGGLSDTIIDTNAAAMQAGVATGVQFFPINQTTLAHAIDQTFDLYAAPRIWNKIIRNGMKQDVSWAAPAAEYLKLYKSV